MSKYNKFENILKQTEILSCCFERGVRCGPSVDSVEY